MMDAETKRVAQTHFVSMFGDPPSVVEDLSPPFDRRGDGSMLGAKVPESALRTKKKIQSPCTAQGTNHKQLAQGEGTNSKQLALGEGTNSAQATLCFCLKCWMQTLVIGKRPYPTNLVNPFVCQQNRSL